MPEPSNESAPTTKSQEIPFEEVAYGRIYGKLVPHGRINIAAFGNISLEIDEENLGLEKISMENLLKGWERDRETFTQHLQEERITLDPFTVYKYYLIQRKTFQVLGQPSHDAAARDRRFQELGDSIKLSETKDHAMCSEYALLSAYIAQKIGEPAHVVIGASIEDDSQQWREAHAYVWIENLNAVFDSVQARSDNEYPALMVPITPITRQALEQGYDITAKRIGTNTIAHYGLEAGGFGLSSAHQHIETSQNSSS